MALTEAVRRRTATSLAPGRRPSAVSRAARSLAPGRRPSALSRAARSLAPGRRHRSRLGRTYLIAGLAGLTTGAVAAAEIARVWRRGSAPLPAEADDVLGAGAEATLQTVEVAVAGYKATPARETALLNLLASFVVSFGAVRASTWTIRSRGTFGPFRDLHVGDHHIHHFVPGIAIAFVTGAAAIATRDPELEKWLAVPYGFGVALTLDESAVLLELEDVYWTEQGVLSVQIALSAAALLASVALALRVLRRGEERVLPEGAA